MILVWIKLLLRRFENMIKPFAFATLMLAFITINANGVQMTISYEDKEQPPYYMGNTSEVLEKQPGIAVEIIQMTAQRINGLEIKLKRTPWKRCIKELGSNKVDGIFNASYKQERLKIGWYPTIDETLEGPPDTSRRLANLSYSFYTLLNSGFKWNGSLSINKGTAIGAPLGYSIVGDLKKMGVVVEEAPSTELNLKKVLAKRIIAAALQEVTADSIIRQSPDIYKKIRKWAPAIVEKTYYLMLSKKFVRTHPELAQKIWDTIKTIRINQFEHLKKAY